MTTSWPPEGPLILGSSQDIHVTKLAEAIIRMRGRPVIVDIEWIRGLVWKARFADSPVARLPRGIIREIPIPDEHSTEPVEASAWVDFVEGLAYDPSVEWLTSLDCLRRADNKLYQLQVAQRAGILFPRTVVSLQRGVLQELLGRSAVLKPLGVGVITEPGSASAVFYATLINFSEMQDSAFEEAPVIAQDYIQPDESLRVMTVGNGVWGASLRIHPGIVDWRTMPVADREWKEITLDPELESMARMMARRAHVGFSAQDWLRVGEDYWFLDLNPVGKWLFLPKRLADKITHALATWLLE